MSDTIKPEDIRPIVRQRYGAIAADFTPGIKPTEAAASCCSPNQSSCCSEGEISFQLVEVERLYQDPDIADLPEEVTGLSLGCGDPVTLAALQPGQVVLDLGSGGGIDCFLAGKKVGPSGKVIGVDMTAAMIERARANQARLGAENVEFRLGEIEHLPVADQSVDVILSNCVINLSPDKLQVFHEAFRVLRSGGKLSVSDIVTDGPLPAAVVENLDAWAGCVAGALDVKDYIGAIEAAGFVDVRLTPVYFEQEVIAVSPDQLQAEPRDFQQKVFSAKITARKP